MHLPTPSNYNLKSSAPHFIFWSINHSTLRVQMTKRCTGRVKKTQETQIQSQSCQNLRKKITLISGDDSIMILLSYGTLVMDDCSAINFVKHVKIAFVQVLSLCSLSCIMFIDICQSFDKETKNNVCLVHYELLWQRNSMKKTFYSRLTFYEVPFHCHNTQCSVHAWLVALLWKLWQRSSCSANYTNLDKINFDMFHKIYLLSSHPWQNMNDHAVYHMKVKWLCYHSLISVSWCIF